VWCHIGNICEGMNEQLEGGRGREGVEREGEGGREGLDYPEPVLTTNVAPEA
jgi:hypothetical protein